MKPPVFILGTQRSGTTLLSRILSSHPNIFIKNEINLKELFSKDVAGWECFEKIKKDIYCSFQIDQDIPEKEISFGLKDPRLNQYLGSLEEIKPFSKFVVIVRDGRGVVNSYKHNKWGLGTNAYTGALRWSKEVEEQLRFYEDNRQNTLLLKYEDMFFDFEGALGRVCRHIGQSFDPSMHNYYLAKSSYKKRKENENTYKSLNVALSQKWKKELSKHEINVIETVAGHLLEKLEYQSVGKRIRIGNMLKLYYRIHQAVIGEIQLQYKWRRSKWLESKKKA